MFSSEYYMKYLHPGDLGLITWSWGRGWNDFREIKFTESNLKVATSLVHTGKVRIKHSPWSLVHLSPSKMRALVQSYWTPWGDGSFNSWSSFKMQSLLKASSLPQPLTQRLRGVKPIKKVNPKVLNFKICWASCFLSPRFWIWERKKEREERELPLSLQGTVLQRRTTISGGT